VDKELGNEAVTYILASGAEGTVHIDHALEYNQDPGMLAELLAHKLTVEAGRRAERSGLSRRELARRLHTSVPQLYRLLDRPTRARASVSSLHCYAARLCRRSSCQIAQGCMTRDHHAGHFSSSARNFRETGLAVVTDHFAFAIDKQPSTSGRAPSIGTRSTLRPATSAARAMA